MFYPNSRHSNILGIILIILGVLVLTVSLGDFMIRLAIAIFGLYLIYSGLRLRNQHHKIFFFFNRFGR